MDLFNTLFFGFVVVLVILFVVGLIRMVRNSPRQKGPHQGSAAAMSGTYGFSGDSGGGGGGGGDGGGGCG